LKDGQSHRGLAVQGAALVLALGAEFDAGHVAQPRDLPGRAGLDDDLAELLGLDVLEILSLRHGGLADLAGGDLHVLLAQGGDDVRGREVMLGHAVRIEPDAHAVVLLAQIGDVAHAFQSGEFIPDLDRRVVAQVELVVPAVRREQVDHQQDVGRLFLGDDARRGHFRRQRGQGLVDAVLHEDLGHVEIDADLEGDRQVVGAVVGALRRHVEHVLNAVDLLFDRRGDRLRHHAGVGAGVHAGDLNRRRRDLGILGDRQDEKRDQPRDGYDDGYDRGEDGPIDEESREHAPAS
jgi:hypothetical protein